MMIMSSSVSQSIFTSSIFGAARRGFIHCLDQSSGRALVFPIPRLAWQPAHLYRRSVLRQKPISVSRALAYSYASASRSRDDVPGGQESAEHLLGLAGVFRENSR